MGVVKVLPSSHHQVSPTPARPVLHLVPKVWKRHHQQLQAQGEKNPCKVCASVGAFPEKQLVAQSSLACT